MNVALFLASTAAPSRDFSSLQFDDFVRIFNRTYTDAAEYSLRQQAFLVNREIVLRQNEAFADGHSTWYAAINEFSDMTSAEFSARKKGLAAHLRSQPALADEEADARSTKTTSFEVDWRNRTSAGGSAVVTPVKDQKACGSCWAFASTATIESYYALATNHLAVLAPQTLVNCAPNPRDCGGTGGCEGSIPELAFNFTASRGIAAEAALPYKAHDEPCRPYMATATLSGYVKLPSNDGAALERALDSVGPVAVNVAANWQHYDGGIFEGGCSFDSSCTLDHVVVATGYRKNAPNGRGGYWLIRNSWGTGWGEAGYIRLTRGYDETAFVDERPSSGVACKPFPKTQRVGGESGVLFDASYPTGVRSWRHA